MGNRLTSVEPPPLPIASPAYSDFRQNQFNNILRLFFNRITATVSNLVSTDNGGRFLYFPRGIFRDTTTQAIAVINTPQAVTFNTSVLAIGLPLSSGSRITANNDGAYAIRFVGQLNKTSAGSAEVYFWLRINGTDAAWSARIHTIDGSPAEIAIEASFTAQLEIDDYVEIVWAADSTAVRLHSEVASAPYPGVPSASLAVDYVSNVL